MLRLLIGTGLLLMTVGFGAAGWQYWQGMATPGAAADGAGLSSAKPLGQGWLVSATGGVVPETDVYAYLAQDRFVEGRMVTVTRSASFAELLAEGENLPDAPYLQVLADIRAPKIAQGLCQVLTQQIAQACAVHSARVVEGSVDPVRGVAQFRIELAYRLKPNAEELPDLAAHVFDENQLPVDLSAADLSSAEAALTAVVAAAVAACGAEGVGRNCRIMDLSLDLATGGGPTASARIGWLAPLPDGMFAAPPLDLPTGG